MSAQAIFKREGAPEWTLERIGRMTVQEIKQLRENAERLNEASIAELCTEALKAARPRPHAAPRVRPSPRTRARHLIARTKAFEARGIYLTDPRTSWCGVRKADGAILFALWASAVVSTGGTCKYLLWAPNAAGVRPWSDTPAGRERLAHCQRAVDVGAAQGLLVYGQALEGYLPEDKAQAVEGADADVLLDFRVERAGDEYWAVWGKKKSTSLASA